MSFGSEIIEWLSSVSPPCSLTPPLGETTQFMPTLDDVYRKFGFASEAAQLLETELGSILFMIGVAETDLLRNPDPQKATDLYRRMNRQTLGQLLKRVQTSTDTIDHLADLLGRALEARNRLSHSFYREHNFRRNYDEGRQIMLDDLEAIHVALLEAYKGVMRLSGVDLDSMDFDADLLPKQHVSI